MVNAKFIDRETIHAKDLLRFWDKVDNVNYSDEHSDECMLWTAGKYKNGYGKFRLGSRMIKAHKFAWLVAQEVPPTRENFNPQLEVCHSCDTRACCNPKHLRLDTKSSNQKDRRKNGNAGADQKLTYADVAEIRAHLKAGKLLQHEIGALYGVTQQQISVIKLGKNWQD